MPAANSRKYPIPCPACHKIAGRPIAVATIKDNRDRLLVSVRCHACDHRWDDVVVEDER
jgi:hypothetical protein